MPCIRAEKKRLLDLSGAFQRPQMRKGSAVSTHRRTAALVAVLALTGASAAQAGVSPATVDEALDPGASITITKTVTTPVIPPKPDIVLVVDQTGSMGGAIDDVKANMAALVGTVQAAQPDTQFAVATYCDFDDSLPAFSLVQDLSGDPTTVTDAVDSIVLCGGGDDPEAQLNALWEIGSGGDAVSYRADSSRIVVWFGDMPGHDPSGGHTEADATTSLTDVEAKVIAISVGANALDATDQATRITAATGGALYTGVGTDVSDAILEGLSNLPAEVTGVPTCDVGLTVSLAPASQTVPSGEDAVFEETITLAADAPQGSTLTCTVDFTVNGLNAGPDFTQSISIAVNDVTPPSVSCVPGPNPAGHIPPASNQDGFFQMFSSDNVDAAVGIYVKDTVSGVTFGPYPSGTTFKLVQAPGAKPQVTAFVGAVQYKFRLKGDAQLIATDAAGNSATALCEVPPAG